MCQEFPKEKWIDAQKENVLDAPYYHVVFTVPEELNPVIYSNQKLLYDATKEKQEPYGQNPENGDLDVLPDLKMTADESTELQTIQVEVKNYINSAKVAFITGTKSLDDDWDTYLKELDACGLQTMIDIYQAAYDRQFKAE